MITLQGRNILNFMLTIPKCSVIQNLISLTQQFINNINIHKYRATRFDYC